MESYADRMKTIWDSLKAAVQSDLIQQIEKKADVDVKQLNSVIGRMFAVWNNAYEQPGELMREIQKAAPDIYEQIQSIRETTRIEQIVLPAKQPAGKAHTGGAAFGAVLAILVWFLFTGVLGSPVWLSILFVIAAFPVGYTYIYGILNTKSAVDRKRLLMQKRSQYISQIEHSGSELIRLCQKLDSRFS
jgi:hypothetical protein